MLSQALVSPSRVFAAQMVSNGVHALTLRLPLTPSLPLTATRCVEAPEVRCVKVYQDVYHLQSTAIFKINLRLKRYLRSAFLAAASNNGLRYAHSRFLIRAAEDLLHQIHSSLLQAGKLRWTCCEATNFRLPFGLRAGKMSRDKIDEVAPEGKLLLGLKRGSSSPLRQPQGSHGP